MTTRLKCAVNPSCTLYKKLFLKKSEEFFKKVWRLQNKVVTLHRKTQTNIFKQKNQRKMQITKFHTPPNEMRVKYGKTDYSIPNYEGYNPYPSVYTDIDGGNWASLFLFLTHEEANHYMHSIITNGYIGVRCSYSLEIKDADLESLPKNYHKCPIPNTKGTDIFTWYVGSGHPDFMASQKDVVSFIRKNIKVETVATVSYCKTLLKVEDEFIIWNKDKAQFYPIWY